MPKNTISKINIPSLSRVVFASASGVAPVNTAAPVISGTAKEGQTLTTTDGTWTGTAPITYTYQWQRNGVDIALATNNTYTLVNGDVGQNITCVVTGTNAFGSDTATSNILVPILNPLAVAGLQLYLAKDNATVSSWLDQSTNAFNFVQGVALKQPTIGANSVDFDGVNDVISVAGSNLLNDSSGIIFFSGYYNGVDTCSLFSSSDNAANNDTLELLVSTSGKVVLAIVKSGVINIIITNESFGVGYFYGFIESSGTSYNVNFNGSAGTFASGTINGDWFADVLNRDDLAIGARTRLATLYRNGQVNKLIYSNSSLSALQKTNVLTFMSLPTNY